MYINNTVMKFKNLVFISHPVTPDSGIMAKIKLDNGLEVSVICGENYYSSSREGHKASCTRAGDAVSYEVLISGMVGDKNFLGMNQISEGWQSKEDIDNLMEKYGAIEG